MPPTTPQYEGEIEPKSKASRCAVPLLAVLRDHLDEHLIRTGREGAEHVFGPTAEHPFAPPVTDQRAKAAGKPPACSRSRCTRRDTPSPPS